MKDGSSGMLGYRCVIGAALGIGMVGCAMAWPGTQVELQAHRVVLAPDSGWGFDFPALSDDLQRVAVISLTGMDRDEVSLRIFRDSRLDLELDFPLDSRLGGNLAVCEGSESCIEEKLAEPNELLSMGGFSTMWPLYGVPRSDDVSVEELIAFYKLRILYDENKNELTIAQAIGHGVDGALMETAYQSGEIYLQQRWHKQRSSATDLTGEACTGVPIPHAAWVNPDWMQIGPRLILVHVSYTTAQGCDFADEWFVQAIE